MDIKALANRVAAKYDTRDPFDVVSALGHIVIFAPLVEMRGLCQYRNRRVILYINSDLDRQQQRLVCAHELGHHFLHRGMNRLFMDRNTYMVTSKYENEANRFALELLFEDSELLNCINWSVTEVAAYLGVPVQDAVYRMETLPLYCFGQRRFCGY